MSTTTISRVELPDGYSVVDRLGAGGYGEVWKATAPGGLEKAVKIVFGHCDEGMAERELKSLERIKSVRHPFLLSIERYEVVNNRLVIVTELADMSLSDCFQSHVAAGQTGIPRDQLIAYLWDAAEALDCLLEQHSLQHLDIKPENLLVVGDHVKVADFGLVKELVSKTLHSMMGGMTPLYSAPEIYDNNPSARSDQYSLAIVYQHMLTGTLPFSGRTPAQLAKQHTLAPPNVNPLSEADRAVVRRALEKDPQDRFASCREFISALRSGGLARASAAASPEAKPAQPAKSISSDDTKSISLIDTKHIRDPICITPTNVLSEIDGGIDDVVRLSRRAASPVRVAYPEVDGQIVDVDTPSFDENLLAAPEPTLFVGVGGIGIKLLKAIHGRVGTYDPQARLPLTWLAIDTDRETLRTSYSEDGHTNLAADDKLHIPLRRPQQYRDDSQALLQWVSRRWLYNIPRSLLTRGFRPLGRVAMVDHAAEVLTALQKRLHMLVESGQETENPQRALRVVVLAGMSGGTGSGTVIDIAQAVRAICGQHGQEVTVHGILGCTYHHDSNDSLSAANMYALLTELNHAQREGNCGENPPPGPAALYELPQRPFDELYTVTIPYRGGQTDADLTLHSVADYLLLNALGTIRPAVSAVRTATCADVEKGLLRTFSCVNIGQLAGAFSANYKQEMLKAIVECWLKPASGTGDPDARYFQTQANSQFARAVLAHFPEVIVDAGEPIDEDALDERRARRSAKIKCLAKAFLQYLDSVQLQPADGQSTSNDAAIATVCSRTTRDVCQLIEHANVADQELAHKIAELVVRHQLDMAGTSNGVSDQELANTALALASTGPLDCGYQRRTMYFVEPGQNNTVLGQSLRDGCPTLATLAAPSDQIYLVREGSGLHPLHLVARLAELYPDIDEAGGRLHSRDDIKWHDLRDTAEPVAAVAG